MDAGSLAFSVAQTLLAALQSKELKQICSFWNYESELERLQKTVKTVKSVLLDADDKQVLSEQEKDFIDELKDALYDADDLFDEFTALVEQHPHLLQGNRKVPNKVRRLLSHFGKMGVAYKMSQQVQKIRKQFDNIADNANKFSFKVDYEPIKNRREESYSYMQEMHVIGREKETDEIINMMLLASDAHVHQIRDVSVLAIVGMGGMGKTTLAQHVYHDQRVKNEFPLRLWACVSDQDQNQLLLQPLLAKILESATGQKQDGSIELLQTKLRDKLRAHKYLLVLDDVWTEERDDWVKLENFLMGGGRGSRVIVTTRSKMTAQVVGSLNPYELQGLSEENSWLLFEWMAFGEGGEHTKCHELVEIGKDIVKKCANVPLSIRVVGSLLYGQGKQKWVSFQERGLAKVIQGENRIMSILKLSYHHLHPWLKSCFSYCALFPKGYVFYKEKLIGLWMAQGYIKQLDEGQSIEAIYEEYFLILVRRCFFQDVKKDEHGEIKSCKIHDLIHDMAYEVTEKQISATDSTSTYPKRIVRHVFGGSYNCTGSFFNNNKIRSFLNTRQFLVGSSFLRKVLVKWTCLRALDLSCCRMESLPDNIGGLLHLRYLDLSYNNLKMLPESITTLHYLQTLCLEGNFDLKEWPKDFSKLEKLRLLNIMGSGLTYMPSGMGKLTCLHRLTDFLVSERNLGSKQRVGDMEDLGALTNLRGCLTIWFSNTYKYVKGMGTVEGGYLSNKEHLNGIDIHWERGNEVVNQEVLLDDLQPHPNLRMLQLRVYAGVRIPRWAREERLKSSLPNLVTVYLSDCHGLKELTPLGKLKFLKFIVLDSLCKLEYIENNTSGTSSTSRGLPESSFFPSLEFLDLCRLPELKGWWMQPPPDQLVVSFPCLSVLLIRECPSLTCIPLCPVVESLGLLNFDGRLRLTIMDQKEAGGALGSYKHGKHPELRSLEIDNVRYLKSLPLGAFQYLTSMKIVDDSMESLLEMGEVLRSCSSSLRSLRISKLYQLKSLSGGLEHLTALESLQLHYLPNLSSAQEEEEEEEDEGMPWRCLGQSLHSLELDLLPKVVNLPKGMQYLTTLQSLKIESHLKALPDWIACLSSLRSLSIKGCDGIESLPESITTLTSLTLLEIRGCSEYLEERCRRPDGEDWPKIQHIPNILVTSMSNSCPFFVKSPQTRPGPCLSRAGDGNVANLLVDGKTRSLE